MKTNKPKRTFKRPRIRYCKHKIGTHLACKKCGRGPGPHVNDQCKCRACVEVNQILYWFSNIKPPKLTAAQRRELAKGD